VWLELFYDVGEYAGYDGVCAVVLGHIFALLFGVVVGDVFFGK
jgi:hypothetical protein